MRVQKAVDTILQQNYGNVPYLISGPPGTGKTKTIVEAGKEKFLSQPLESIFIGRITVAN